MEEGSESVIPKKKILFLSKNYISRNVPVTMKTPIAPQKSLLSAYPPVKQH